MVTNKNNARCQSVEIKSYTVKPDLSLTFLEPTFVLGVWSVQVELTKMSYFMNSLVYIGFPLDSLHCTGFYKIPFRQSSLYWFL
jgi:hypothetical protein